MARKKTFKNDLVLQSRTEFKCHKHGQSLDFPVELSKFIVAVNTTTSVHSVIRKFSEGKMCAVPQRSWRRRGGRQLDGGNVYDSFSAFGLISSLPFSCTCSCRSASARHGGNVHSQLLSETKKAIPFSSICFQAKSTAIIRARAGDVFHKPL